MPSNIEIKARAKDFDRLKGLVEEIADGPGEVLEQEDTFFHAPRGRLKLRVLGPASGQLISYERADEGGPKPSSYLIARTADPESLKATLEASLGIRGAVRKRRLLHRCGQTRIHLDDVEGLGRFLELEYALRDGQDAAEGLREVRRLMGRLEIQKEDLVAGAYVDLIAPRSPER